MHQLAVNWPHAPDSWIKFLQPVTRRLMLTVLSLSSSSVCTEHIHEHQWLFNWINAVVFFNFKHDWSYLQLHTILSLLILVISCRTPPRKMYLQSKPGPLQRSYELLTDYEVNPCRKVFILNVGMLIWQQNNPSLGVYVSVCRIVRNAAEMLLVCRVACLMKFKIWFKLRASKTFLLAYISGRKFWRNQLYYTGFLHKLTINVSTGNCCWIFTVTLFVTLTMMHTDKL